MYDVRSALKYGKKRECLFTCLLIEIEVIFPHTTSSVLGDSFFKTLLMEHL